MAPREPKSVIRGYDEGRDLEAIERIWYEIGWIENARQARYLADFLSVGRCLTATVGEDAECMVHVCPGTMWLSEAPLDMCAVTAVTTSHIGRRRGLARELTARQLAFGAGQGAAVATLGMFEQGFYDRLGFGSGSYQHQFDFDPATLMVNVPHRAPARLTRDDWREMHGAMARRLKNHGACVLAAPELLKAELGWSENGFGLGYYEGDALSHFIWLTHEDKPEHGPYRVNFIAYRDRRELLELLAVLQSLGDQISMISMEEPAHLQLQDVLRQPIRVRRNTRNSPFGNQHLSLAYWQIRALNVPACVAACETPSNVHFNLTISDPLSELLPDDEWCGVAGEYVVHVGSSSSAEPGSESSLPTLHASVGAFTRLLFGIVSASNLAASDALSAPDELLVELDRAFVLPRANTGWDF